MLKKLALKVWHNDKQLNFQDFVKDVKLIRKIIEQKTYKEALTGPYAKAWQKKKKKA